MTKRSSPFAPAVKRWARKGLDDQPIDDSPRWMEAGWHNALIEDVDTDVLASDGKIWVTYKNQAGSQHRESTFILSQDGQDLSFAFRALIGAVLPELEALEVYQELLADAETYEQALQCLRGMKVAIKIEPSPGYRIVSIDGGYEAEDAVYGDFICGDRTYESVEKKAKDEGIPKSYRQIKRYEVTDDDSADYNLDAFDAACSAIVRTQEPEGNATGSNNRRFTQPDTDSFGHDDNGYGGPETPGVDDIPY